MTRPLDGSRSADPDVVRLVIEREFARLARLGVDQGQSAVAVDEEGALIGAEDDSL